MKLKTTDIEKIERRICETKGCSKKAYGVIKTKYLCKMCYEEIKPPKYHFQGRWIRNY